MADQLIEIAEDFWNVRGSFKIAGLLDIGTQCSLARLQSGRFALLDAYTLAGEVKERIFARTEGGRAIEAVLHLHPFHTLHVEPVAALLPHALHYGSARHRQRASGLRWAPESVESPAFAERFAADLDFTIPQGVDFIPADERQHFSSVLALHRASRSLHVDDTLVWSTIPFAKGLSFHLSLPKVLQRRAGAAGEFRRWAGRLIELSAGVDHLCTAHGRKLPPTTGLDLPARIEAALRKVEGVLSAHERRWG